ncbi:hypothetical protein PEPS_40990 (plasmid) [Persicobacter psychrovividus]|uniref:Uncharacterized protein n=1 Tax=Persicobacter psychrovividus TaxID=387638 RepID=A0ABM7VLE6_9BACT|nr:hypothetical protein PEPS_40990 [Persicobacter psychrovividus]
MSALLSINWDIIFHFHDQKTWAVLKQIIECRGKYRNGLFSQRQINTDSKMMVPENC